MIYFTDTVSFSEFYIKKFVDVFTLFARRRKLDKLLKKTHSSALIQTFQRNFFSSNHHRTQFLTFNRAESRVR